MDIVNLLIEELNSRKLKNPKYSLRAFARDLGLDVSYLAKLINKKAHLSRGALAKIIMSSNSLNADLNRLILARMILSDSDLISHCLTGLIFEAAFEHSNEERSCNCPIQFQKSLKERIRIKYAIDCASF